MSRVVWVFLKEKQEESLYKAPKHLLRMEKQHLTPKAHITGCILNKVIFKVTIQY